ncbi:MAG: hypothetical protein NZL83_02340 [Candidatus Absconditabacterales bacterium]|nr:hypothetical protein [Candidatus Absconditabacterales bacterium]
MAYSKMREVFFRAYHDNPEQYQKLSQQVALLKAVCQILVYVLNLNRDTEKRLIDKIQDQLDTNNQEEIATLLTLVISAIPNEKISNNDLPVIQAFRTQLEMILDSSSNKHYL